MKAKQLIIFLLLNTTLFSQVITYNNFILSYNDTTWVKLANNSSFNNALKTVIGNGVTWDASALTQLNGTPTFQMVYVNPTSTSNGNLYPNSNYAFGDPTLPSIVGYTYYELSLDSLVTWGYYDPSTKHEIFQNPDKHLIFPFAYGQSFTDNYEKTNYSDANTISSYQNGTRIVEFNGYGTLILPQGSLNDVALIKETRTNNLGPTSFIYTWYNINTGKKLLIRDENGGDINTIWCSETIMTINDENSKPTILVYPNPANNYTQIAIYPQNGHTDYHVDIYNSIGQKVSETKTNNNIAIIPLKNLPKGLYTYIISNENKIIKTDKLIIQ